MTLTSESETSRTLQLTTNLDIDVCLALAADSRPWLTRTAWHERAACIGCHANTYVGNTRPSPSDLERCVDCPVRPECAVDGLRQSFEGLLAESRDELWGYFGGLGPDERWDLAETLRRTAAERGLALCDATQHGGELIEKYHGLGWLTSNIAVELDIPHDAVVDHLALTFSERGWSNRRIAAAVPGRSYKWYERRLRQLRAAKEQTHEAA